MSVFQKFGDWFLATDRAADRAWKQLIDSTRPIASRLKSKEVAEGRLQQARQFVEDHDPDNRWSSWRGLIRIHKRAQDQLELVRKSLLKLEQARKRDQHNELRVDFLKKFSHLSKRPTDLNSLETMLTDIRGEWTSVLSKIAEIRPPVYFTHAFLKLSESSGLGIATLFLGGLIGLGALHLSVFHQAAVGLSASVYWTQEDLFNQGIVVLPFVVGVLLAFEVAFHLLSSADAKASRYTLHGIILDRPVTLVLSFAVLTILVVASFAYRQGLQEFKDFTKMNLDTAEMATVMDGTVLRNVHLVGTTDRTAIFLKASLKAGATADEFKEWRDKVTMPKSVFWETVFGLKFPSDLHASYDLANRVDSGSAEEPYSLRIMDRALIVCHGKLGDCEVADRSEHGDEAAALVEKEVNRFARLIRNHSTLIENINISSNFGSKLDQLGTDHSGQSKGVGDLQEFVNREFKAVNTHMNRHLEKTIEAMEVLEGTFLSRLDALALSEREHE